MLRGARSCSTPWTATRAIQDVAIRGVVRRIAGSVITPRALLLRSGHRPRVVEMSDQPLVVLVAAADHGDDAPLAPHARDVGHERDVAVGLDHFLAGDGAAGL